MYESVQISDKCYYINCPAKIGVYIAHENNVFLIDSGNDKDAGRKVRQFLLFIKPWIWWKAWKQPCLYLHMRKSGLI